MHSLLIHHSCASPHSAGGRRRNDLARQLLNAWDTFTMANSHATHLSGQMRGSRALLQETLHIHSAPVGHGTEQSRLQERAHPDHFAERNQGRPHVSPLR
jgi:hypothetical protein